MRTSPSTKIISKILSPALQFWLRSQVEEVNSLVFKIQGQDQQILRGYIPEVHLSSQDAVYQGLHLGIIEVVATNIRINIGQVLRGKPFRLLEPIQVSGQIKISTQDLQSSITSSILINALNELLLLLLESSGVPAFGEILTQGSLTWQHIDLGEQCFKLGGIWTSLDSEIYPFTLSAALRLLSGQSLYLDNIEVKGLPSTYQVTLTELRVELGTDINLSTLLVAKDELQAQGDATIRN